MTTNKPRVLFLSTGDATRGLIAEGFLRNFTADRFDIVSVGGDPSTSNPLASAVMMEADIDISGQKPRSVAQSLKERFGHVITICDTAIERNPIFLSRSVLAIGVSLTPIPPKGCPSRKQKFFAGCETRSRTRLNNS
jgi:Protein-tyrosine-phosphatase